MTKDKKSGIDKVKETSATDIIKKVSKVDTVDEVAPVSKVGGVKHATGVKSARLPRELTVKEREQLFKLVDEEADKLFSGPTAIAPKRKKLVQEAVKMAIDSGLMDDADQKEK